MKRVAFSSDGFRSGGFLDATAGSGLVAAHAATSFGVDCVYGIESDPLLHKHSIDVVAPWVERQIGENITDCVFLLMRGDLRFTRDLEFLPQTLSSVCAIGRHLDDIQMGALFNIVHDKRVTTLASTYSPEDLSRFADLFRLVWPHSSWLKRSLVCKERVALIVEGTVCECYIYKVEICDRCFDPLEGFGVPMRHVA
jgi:hypothetical protein